MRTFTYVAFVFVLLALFGAGSAVAQSPSSLLTIVVNPASPRPNQTVTATLDAVGLDIVTAAISWSIDEKRVAEGIGRSEITFQVGKGGSQTRVEVMVLGQDGKTTVQSIILRPSTVDLVWEANSFTPHFYKGRALYTVGSRVSVIALPELTDSQGRVLNAPGLLYTWSKDGDVVAEGSGVGKQRFNVPGTFVDRPTLISVDVKSLDGRYRGESAVTLETTSPRVLFYEEDPIVGTRHNRALGQEFRLAGQEMTLHAYPFFFEASTKDDTRLVYSWSINGEATDNKSTSPFLITLRRNAEDRGASEINLALQHVNKALQNAGTAIRIIYGQ